MKRVLFLLASAVMMFGAASCQREILPDGVTGDVNVKFNVELPDGVSTKSIGDGTNVNILYYEIYNADMSQKLVKGSEVRSSEKTFELDLTLIAGQTYNFLFWAQVDGKDYYNVDDLKAVKVNYTYTDDEGKVVPYPANDEARAAFFAHKEFKITDYFSETVYLKRPFAQLNFGTTSLESDLSEGNLSVKTSKIKVSEAAAEFNVYAGVGSQPVEAVFGLADAPTDPATITVADVPYHYLSMNYFFVNGESSNVTVSAEFTTYFGSVSHSIVEVPIAQNYRTNIIGDLLFNQAKLSIIVDEKFNEPDKDVFPVYDVASLQAAVDNASEGGEVKLMQDVDLNDLFNTIVKSGGDPQYVTVAKGKSIVLNLNGYSITGVDETEKNFGLIQNNGTLSIVNTSETMSKISLVSTKNSGWNRYSAVISNNPGGVLTVGSNVTIQHHGGTDMAYGIDILTNGGIGDVNATIDGATVKSTYRAIRQFLNSDSKNNTLVIKSGSDVSGDNKGLFFHDPNKKANLGKLIVEDDAKVNSAYLFVTEGSTEWPVEVSIACSALSGEPVSMNVPEGYSIDQVDNCWVVIAPGDDATDTNGQE